MSELIRSQYEILSQIRSFEDQTLALKRELTKIPEQISELESTLEGRKLQFEAAKEVFEKHSKRLREAELELKGHEAQIVKAQEKLMEVKTNDAYAAALKEIEGQKNQKSKLEDEILELMTKLETETVTFKEAEQEFKSHETSHKAAVSKLKEEEQGYLSSIKDINSKKGELAASLDTSAAECYKQVEGRVPSPITEAANQMCGGCRIKLRPQLFNFVIGFTGIHQCPNCSRILISLENGSSEN